MAQRGGTQTGLSPWQQFKELLVVAIWFGLAGGLIEGSLFWLLQSFAFLRRMEVAREILWVSPVFNATLFSVAALFFGLGARLFFSVSVTVVAVFFFTLVTTSAWLELLLTPWPVYQWSLLILALGVTVAFIRWYSGHAAMLMRFWRRTLAYVSMAVILVFLVQDPLGIFERFAIPVATARLEYPNILIIVVDTLRADHVSSYGYERLTTPNIDRLAKEGVLFETALSASPWTAPSHAAILTGRLPHETGVGWFVEDRMLFRNRRLHGLDGRYPLLSEVLLAKGYKTAAFSANPWYFTRDLGFDRGFIRFEDNLYSLASMAMSTVVGDKITTILSYAGFDVGRKHKSAREVTDSALGWLRHGRNHPFFVFLNYFDAHHPYPAPTRYRKKFAEKNIEKVRVRLPDANTGRFTFPSARARQAINAYDGAIAYVDYNIGQLLAGLEKLGLTDNLLVILTSDHGEAFGEHGTMQHANSVYREEIHVPLIFWQPRRLPAGLRVSQAVSNSLIPATIMDLLGAKSVFPGPSLAQWWQTPQARVDWPFPISEMEYWPWSDKKSPVHYGSMRSVVGRGRHFIKHDTLGIKLFDWNHDVLEAHDLKQIQAEQKAVRELELSIDATKSTLAKNAQYPTVP